MIVYLAHWDWILTQSRKDVVSNINDSEFMAICPFDRNEIELGNYYKETIDWKLNRNKIFDFCENPIAAETPESGIGTTTSASILFSIASYIKSACSEFF